MHLSDYAVDKVYRYKDKGSVFKVSTESSVILIPIMTTSEC